MVFVIMLHMGSCEKKNSNKDAQIHLKDLFLPAFDD